MVSALLSVKLHEEWANSVCGVPWNKSVDVVSRGFHCVFRKKCAKTNMLVKSAFLCLNLIFSPRTFLKLKNAALWKDFLRRGAGITWIRRCFITLSFSPHHTSPFHSALCSKSHSLKLVRWWMWMCVVSICNLAFTMLAVRRSLLILFSMMIGPNILIIFHVVSNFLFIGYLPCKSRLHSVRFFFGAQQRVSLQ